MNQILSKLEPQALWQNFESLNSVPRASKNEERVIAFMKKFGEKLGLETIVDETGNVLIKKPASPGMEMKETIILQSHLDMVHQKNKETDFDFSSQGIHMYIDDDWVKARGTTLGADNGIGVAAIMTILASEEIQHPAIEALFTIDEETGMTGAKGLKEGFLTGNILLNLDTEDDRELTIGCAGGIDVTISGNYKSIAVPDDHEFFQLTIKGLKGGHSGMDIHLGRANANKLMNRFLSLATEDLKIGIHEINGGGLRNAIPRESHAIFAIQKSKIEELQFLIDNLEQIIKSEYHSTDPALSLSLTRHNRFDSVLGPLFQHRFLKAIYAAPNGIYRMSPEVSGLVQTSNNLAQVVVANGSYKVLCLTRGSVDSEKLDLAMTIKNTFELIDGKVEFSGSYPGWAPNPEAEIIHVMSELYKELFGEDADVNACHAGLECGIIGSNYPAMEMISFGPNIRGAHSPDEKVQISSVQKFWNFLLETLRRIPEKKN